MGGRGEEATGGVQAEGIPDGAHSGTRGVLRRRERTVPYRPGGGRSPVRGRLGRSAPLPRQQARESVGDLRRGRRTHGRGAGIRTERTSALLLPGAGLPQGVGRYRIEREVRRRPLPEDNRYGGAGGIPEKHPFYGEREHVGEKAQEADALFGTGDFSALSRGPGNSTRRNGEQTSAR